MQYFGGLDYAGCGKMFRFACKPPKTTEWLNFNGIFCVLGESISFAKKLRLKSLTTLVTNPLSSDMADSFVKTVEFERLDVRPDLKTVMD